MTFIAAGWWHHRFVKEVAEWFYEAKKKKKKSACIKHDRGTGRADKDRNLTTEKSDKEQKSDSGYFVHSV